MKNESNRILESIKTLFNKGVVVLSAVLFSVNTFAGTLRGETAVGSGKGTVKVEIYSRYAPLIVVDKKETSGSSPVSVSMGVNIASWGFCKFHATPDDGYSFEAWYTNSACTTGRQTGNPYQTSDDKGGDRTDSYYAKFIPNTYTVTFNADGGSVSPTTSTVTYDAAYGAGTGGWPTPTRTNYTFVGWYTYGGTKIESSTIYKQTQDQTLTAHWEPNYTIRFNGNGSTSGSMGNMAMVHGTSKTLTANAYARQYTISYNVQGGVAISNTVVTYTFAGWATSASGAVVYSNKQNVDIDAAAGSIVDLYAVWSPAAISITLPGTTKGDSNLEGWYLSGTKVGEVGDSYTPTSSVTLVANWDRFTPIITGSGNQSMKVEEERVGDFSFVHTDSPIAHISVSSISSINDGSGKVIEYDAVNNKIIARNAGVATIHFEQPETSTIKHKSFTTYTYTVTKWDNALKTPFETENSWTQTMTYNSGRVIRKESNNTITPIVVTQTSGDRVATYYDASTAIYTSGLTGSATWSVSQAENYKYVAATTQTMTVNVIPDAEATNCYVLNTGNAEHTFFTEFDYTGHFGDEDVYALSGPGEKLYFEAAKDAVGFNYFVAQYSTDNGNRWEDVVSPELTSSYQTFGPYTLPTNTTHIRFGAKVGGTLTKYYKNVRVTRRTVLTVDDVVVNRKSDGTPIYTGEDGVATLNIDYSIANGGDLHIANDNPSKFEVSSSIISVADCSTGSASVTITYHANESEAVEDVAHFVIYNSVYSQEITVTGVTLKHDQLGQWQNISMMTLGTDVFDAFTSTLSELNGVTYSIVSGTAVTISGGKLIATEVGTATIHAHVDGDAIYNAIDSEITITVTELMVQYIQWSQNLLHLHVGDPNVVMTAAAQSNLECETNGSRPITYVVKGGSTSVVQIVNDNELKINGVGTVYIIASQAGGWDSDGHEYIAVSTEKKVVVRDAACVVNIYEQVNEREFDMGSSKFELMNGAMEIDFMGKEPDSYSFDYKGRIKGGAWYEFWAEYLEGTMTVEEYVDGEWWLVENLGTPTADIYKTASHSLNHRATKMRIAISNARGYHYINNCVVKFARYLEAWEGGYEKYALSFNAPLNSSDSRLITFKYSNISSPLVLTLSDGAPFLLNKTEIDGECGDTGSEDIILTYAPTAVETDAVYTLTITDGEELTKVITLTASAFAEECIFMESASNEDWLLDTNWDNSMMPTISRAATIEHDVVIATQVSAYSVTITNGAVVTIAPTGGLTVGAGGIINASTSNLILQAGTDGATKGQTGFIRISPDYVGEMPQAKVQMFSIGYYHKEADTEDENIAAWQYVGTPIDFGGALAKTVFTRSWIYSYVESSDSWVNNRSKLVMQPFVGYATTQYDDVNGKMIEYAGTLNANRGVHTINLAYTDAEHGYNVVANSFAAPIDITKMRRTDFVNVADPTIYLFHTGTHKQAEDWGIEKGSSAGQFISIAIGTAAEMAELFKDEDIPTTIAPMQGFGVYATGAGAQLKLDYTKLVWNANYVAHPNKPMRVANLHQEETDSIEEVEISGSLRMSLSANGWSDKCYLLESESYDTIYEAGFDALKKESGRLNIFTLAENKQLAVNATNSIIGTQVGVRTGNELYYTLSFSNVLSEEAMSLIDNETNQKIDINEGTVYPFSAVPNSTITDRFQIVARNDAPSVTTGVDEIQNETKAYKFIKDGQMYILKNGVLYNAMGGIVR